MTVDRRREIESIFDGALDRPADDRSAWLAERCAGDGALQREVEALLSAHGRVDGVLDRPPPVAVPFESPAMHRHIGPYRVLRELGRGGMGVVYLADRDDGHFRRRVAVKLLRASPDAEELHRRFRAERQILASLAHPNIAQLLDGGITDGQLPYLVMEYVEGLPITAYCDRKLLGIEERLRLFQSVCAAVHHAHRNLIVHRDLKPGNILVTDRGEAKLLDFGIAKLLNPTLAAITMPVTHMAHRLMTPQYASPEQVCGDPLSTASDVYSLGVILYELLAGHRPYQLAAYSPGEIANIVCEREPQRPSSIAGATERVVGDDGMAVDIVPATVAAARGTSAERLRQTLRGDLDAIVMMALRKEPVRRYGSADLLAADVQRYLDGLPVTAYAGSRWYRTRSFLRRRRLEATAAAIVAAAMVGGTAIAMSQAAAARRAQARAESALASSDAVSSFLVSLLEAYQPEQLRGGSDVARNLLAQAAAEADRLASEPVVQARMFEAMGRVHRGLGEYQRARSLLDRSIALREAELGRDHPDVATSLFHLADVLRRQGQYADATTASRRALAIRSTALGDSSPAVADVLAQLSSLSVYQNRMGEAETLARRAADVRRSAGPSEESRLPTTLESLGSVLYRRGNVAESERVLRESLVISERVLGPDHVQSGYGMLRLADVVRVEPSREDEAEALYREGLRRIRAAVGERHPSAAWAMADLAGLIAPRGKAVEAERLARESLDILRTVFGPDHPTTAGALEGHAFALLHAGRLVQAESLQRASITTWERSVGRNHSAYLQSVGRLATIRMERGALDEADSLLRHTIRVREEELGQRGSVLVGLVVAAVGDVAARRGDLPAADSLYHRALAILRESVADGHVDVRRVNRALAALYERWGRRADAAEYRRRAEGR